MDFSNSFSNSVSEEELTLMDDYISDEELHQTIKETEKDNSPSPHGWARNFLHYFTLWG